MSTRVTGCRQNVKAQGRQGVGTMASDTNSSQRCMMVLSPRSMLLNLAAIHNDRVLNAQFPLPTNVDARTAHSYVHLFHRTLARPPSVSSLDERVAQL